MNIKDFLQEVTLTLLRKSRWRELGEKYKKGEEFISKMAKSIVIAALQSEIEIQQEGSQYLEIHCKNDKCGQKYRIISHPTKDDLSIYQSAAWNHCPVCLRELSK